MAARVTKKDVVVGELRRRIDSGELSRGDWLRQDVLAEELQVSITPVREALRELQAEGALIGHPHRGVQVATIDLEQVKGIYMCRRLLEPYAVQRAAAEISRRDLDQARQLNEAIRVAGLAGDGLAASEFNRDMHFVFYDKSGPDSFVETIRDLWLAFPWDMMRLIDDRVANSFKEHAAMIDAVERNDLEAIRATVGEHILHGYRDLARVLKSSDEWADAPTSPVEVDPFEQHDQPTSD